MIENASAWLPEKRRAGVSLLVTVVIAAVALVVARSVPRLSTNDVLVIALAVYMTVHLVITATVFSHASRDVIGEWAKPRRRGNFLQRYVLGTAPGPGASIAISAVALVVALRWLPGAMQTRLPDGLRIFIGVTLVLAAWAAVWVSFAVTYLADDIQSDGQELDFPGSQDRDWSDYVYFSLAIMTTFGTTDVTVTSSNMRRTVTVCSLVAFVFNTVIITAAVGTVSP